MKQVLMAGSLATVTAERWMPINGAATPQTTEAAARVQTAGGGTLREFRVSLTAAPGAGTSWTATVVKNGTDTAMEVTISDTDTTGIDSVEEVTFAAGDYLTVRYTPTGSVAATALRHGVEEEGTDALGVGGGGTGPTGSTTQYRSPFSFGAGNPTESTVETTLPLDLTAKGFYVTTSTAVATGGTLTCQLRKNGADVSGATFDITAGNTTNSITGRTDAFAEGDRLSIALVADSVGFIVGTIALGIVYEPDTDGESVICNQAGALSNSADNFTTFGGGATWSSNNSVRRVVSTTPDWVLKRFRVSIETAPGAGTSRTFTVMNDATELTSEVAISGTDTSGVDNTNTDTISDLDLLNVKSVPADSPGNSGATRFSAVMFIAPEAATGAPGKVMMVG